MSTSATLSKGLNKGASSNRFKYTSQKKQAAQLSTLDVHNKKRDRARDRAAASEAAAEAAAEATSEATTTSTSLTTFDVATSKPPLCILLEDLLATNPSPILTRLCHKLYPLTLSLVEILHHHNKIVALTLAVFYEYAPANLQTSAPLTSLTSFLKSQLPQYSHSDGAYCPPSLSSKSSPDAQFSLPAILTILSAISQTLTTSILSPTTTAFSPHLVHTLTLLSATLSSSATASDLPYQLSLLTTFGTVLKHSTCHFLATTPSDSLSLLRTFYGPILGSSALHVRRLAGQSFATVFRSLPAAKQTKSRFKAHYRKTLDSLEAQLPPASSSSSSSLSSSFPPRVLHLLSGMTFLLTSILTTSPTTNTFHSLHSLYYPVLLADLLASPSLARFQVLSSLVLNLSRQSSRRIVIQAYDDNTQQLSFNTNILAPLLAAIIKTSDLQATAAPPNEAASLIYAIKLLRRMLGYHTGWGMTSTSLPPLLSLLTPPSTLLANFATHPPALQSQIVNLLTDLYKTSLVPSPPVAAHCITALTTLLPSHPTISVQIAAEVLPTLSPTGGTALLEHMRESAAAAIASATDPESAIITLKHCSTADATDAVTDPATKTKITKTCLEIATAHYASPSTNYTFLCALDVLLFTNAATTKTVKALTALLKKPSPSPRHSCHLLQTISLLPGTGALLHPLVPTLTALLTAHPADLSILAAAAAFHDHTPAPASLLALLTPNLKSKSNKVRLFTLRILSNLPPSPLLLSSLPDDADAALSDSAALPPCTILASFLALENTPLTIDNERVFGTTLANVAVLARRKKLPTAHALAAAHYVLGLFSCKLSTVWPFATDLSFALEEQYKSTLWATLQPVIVATTFADYGPTPTPVADPDDEEDPDLEGDKTALADAAILANSLKEVYENPHPTAPSTDDLTFHQLVWQSLPPTSLLKNSRTLVPLFLDFMNEQVRTPPAPATSLPLFLTPPFAVLRLPHGGSRLPDSASSPLFPPSQRPHPPHLQGRRPQPQEHPDRVRSRPRPARALQARGALLALHFPPVQP